MIEPPDRMKHLDRDRRGYPIPFGVYRDRTGKPHFTINDEETRRLILSRDLCGICGQKLFRGRWFVGGTLSAFHEDGAFNDPPMHHECARYALIVCPYLALPSYRTRIDDKTLSPNDPILLMDTTMIDERPSLFVCAMAVGQTISPSNHIVPKRPWRRVEYWRDGAEISQEQGEREVHDTLAQPIPEMEPPKFVNRRKRA